MVPKSQLSASSLAIDEMSSTTTNTTARAQQVDFAPTHFVGSIAVATKANSGINNLLHVNGKTVTAVTGSTSIQLLRSVRKTENLQISEVYGKDNAETFLMLTSDRAQAMMLEDVQLAGLIARTDRPSDYRIPDERLRDEPYGFMVRKNDPQFKAVVDYTLIKLMKSGEIQQLYAKWFSKPVPPAGVNLNYPMPEAVKEAYRNPNNKGI